MNAERKCKGREWHPGGRPISNRPSQPSARNSSSSSYGISNGSPRGALYRDFAEAFYEGTAGNAALHGLVAVVGVDYFDELARELGAKLAGLPSFQIVLYDRDEDRVFPLWGASGLTDPAAADEDPVAYSQATRARARQEPCWDIARRAVLATGQTYESIPRGTYAAPVVENGRVLGFVGLHQHALHHASEHQCSGYGEQLMGNVLASSARTQIDKAAALVGERYARARAEMALREREDRYRFFYDENPAILLTVGADGSILSVNRFGAARLGYRVDELIGAPASILMPPREIYQWMDTLRARISTGDGVKRRDVSRVARDGSLIWLRETVRVVETAAGERNMLVVGEDVTALHSLSEQLEYQACHDALTGLDNRLGFDERLEQLLQTARTDGSEHALCLLDLDQFKLINDVSGHAAGDVLLQQMAELLNAQVGEGDVVARLGGDEFGILLADCAVDRALHTAGAIRDAVGDYRFKWGKGSYGIGVSIGLVPINEMSNTSADLLRAADVAVYAAKDAGRNRVHLLREGDEELASRHGEMAWASRITRALEEDRFCLSFQPIVPLKEPGNRRAGIAGRHCELLLRVQGEDGEAVSIPAFWQAAERFHLAVKVDRWVIKRAFEWLSNHPMVLESLELCSLNLSGHSLGDEGLLDYVREQQARAGLPGHKICFEITETAAIANMARATRFMWELRRSGYRFALDDFGSGLSSFAYLKALPVDFVKIDGQFVKDMLENSIDMAMVRSINEIGQVMGKRTIAEFVENDRILERLREIGVDYGQGYRFGEPMPIECFPHSS